MGKLGMILVLLIVAVSLFSIARTANAGFFSNFVPPFLGTTVAMGGALLIAGGCVSVDTTVNGAQPGMVVSVSPQTNPGNTAVWLAYVSAQDTVTTKVCAILALTPASTVYNLRVFPGL